MIDASRRTFVSSLVVGVPALAFAEGQAAPSSNGPDPVWQQIMSELQRVYAEFMADPSRRDSLRGLESTIRMHAAYSSALGHGRTIQRAVSSRLRNGRREFLEEAQRLARREHRVAESKRVLPGFVDRGIGRPDLGLDEIERSARMLTQNGGHVPLLITTAHLVQQLGQQRGPYQQARALARQSICESWEAWTQLFTGVGGVVCGLAWVMPALAPECAALLATVGTMELLMFFFC
jgi:hypothetical protein